MTLTGMGDCIQYAPISAAAFLLHTGRFTGERCKTSGAAILRMRCPMSLLVLSRSKSFLGTFVILSLAALLCVLQPQSLTAQISTTGRIAGTVTDSSGSAVPNASVSAKSAALLAPRSTHTEADGSYLFDLLPPGTYEVTVTAPGFSTFSQSGIVLTAGFTATINSKLQVGE